METTIKNNFKAVDFMRQVRNELSDLYHTDKESYYNELKKSMAEFLKVRTKPTTTKKSNAETGLEVVNFGCPGCTTMNTPLQHYLLVTGR